MGQLTANAVLLPYLGAPWVSRRPHSPGRAGLVPKESQQLHTNMFGNTGCQSNSNRKPVREGETRSLLVRRQIFREACSTGENIKTLDSQLEGSSPSSATHQQRGYSRHCKWLPHIFLNHSAVSVNDGKSTSLIRTRSATSERMADGRIAGRASSRLRKIINKRWSLVFLWMCLFPKNAEVISAS